MLEIKLDAERLDHGLSTLLKNATDTRTMMQGIATRAAVSVTEKKTSNPKVGADRDGNKAGAPRTRAQDPAKKEAGNLPPA